MKSRKKNSGKKGKIGKPVVDIISRSFIHILNDNGLCTSSVRMEQRDTSI